jgi:hypothetical protein
LPVLRMGDRHRERVGGVGRADLTGRKQYFDHHRDLGLFGMTGADDGLLDDIGGIFGDRKAEQGGRGERNAARLAEFQRRLRIAIDESLLNRRLIGPLGLDQGG